MNWIDTNTLITICTGAIGLTQFILWKHIAKVKAYEAEKGKNLATKAILPMRLNQSRINLLMRLKS